MKKSKVIRRAMLIGCMVLMVSFAHACTACEPTPENKITFNENLVAELGKEYDPEIEVGKDSTIYSVKLYDENGNEVILEDGYKFVPESIGQYYYKVVIDTKGVREEKSFAVTVLDITAPTIVQSIPTAVATEVGVYLGFSEDMEKIEIADDNVTMISHATKKAVAITFNGKTEENAAGYEQYFFKEVGEYTVIVAVADVSGNTAYTEYKINTVDTTAPVVNMLPLQYVWLDDQGNAPLPYPSVHDISATQVSVEARLADVPLTITDGKVSATVGDILTVSYVVKDLYNNETTVESQVKILQKGQLFDKTDKAVAELFTAKEGVVEYDNGVSFVSEKTSDTLEWLDGAYTFNSTEFNGIGFKMKNLGMSEVKVHVAAKQNSEKIYIGSFDLIPTGEELTYTFDLSKYALSEVDGWMFEMKSTASLNITLTEGYLIKIENEEVSMPDSTESEIEKKAYTFESVYNGGFKKNSDGKYIKNGAYSAEATVKANNNVGVIFKNAPCSITNENYLSFDVYANTAGSIKVGVVIGESYTEYKSGEIELARGWNTVGFVIDKIDSNFNGASVNGIFCYNVEKYDNVFYIDDLVFSQKTELADEEVFALLSEVQADTTKLFTVPNVLICDDKLVKQTEVVIEDKTGEELIHATHGEKVSLTDFTDGEYRIVYTVLDFFGKTHEKTIKLTVKNNLLSGTIGLKTYRINEVVELPDPNLSSGKYTQSELANATVHKYYRGEGGLEWILATENLQFTESGYYDVKYIVAIDDVKISIMETTYIHDKDVYFDFEAYENGAHMGGGTSTGAWAGHDVWISDEWSRSGKYSLYVNGGTRGATWIGMDYTRGEFQFDAPVDTITFWAYSVADKTNAYIGIAWYPNETATRMSWVEPYVSIKAGVHKYVLNLNTEITRIDRLYFESYAFECMYIDDVVFTHSPTAEFPDVSGQDFFSNEPIVLTKPKLLNVNPIAFTEEDISSASYMVRVKSANGATTYNFAQDSLALNLKKGQYTLTFTVKFLDWTYVSEQTIFVRDLNVMFTEPIRVFDKGSLYRLQMPEAFEDGVSLSAYYRKQGETNWTKLSIEEDKAKVVLETVGNYEIRFLAEKGELVEEEIYKVLVRAENTILDLELNENGTHFGAEKHIYGGAEGKITDEWSYDGKYSYYVSGGHDFFRFGNVNTQDSDRIVLGGNYNTIAMWIYADKDMGDLVLEPWTDRGAWLKSSPVKVKEGVHQYVFTFNESFSSLRAVGFEFEKDRLCDFYIDCVQVYNVTVEGPRNIPKQVNAGEQIKINDVDIKIESNGLSANTTVKYKKSDGAEWKEISLTNGEYTLAFETGGSYEIVIDVSIGGVSHTYEYLIVVLDENTDPWTEDTTWN